VSIKIGLLPFPLSKILNYIVAGFLRHPASYGRNAPFLLSEICRFLLRLHTLFLPNGHEIQWRTFPPIKAIITSLPLLMVLTFGILLIPPSQTATPVPTPCRSTLLSLPSPWNPYDSPFFPLIDVLKLLVMEKFHSLS